MKISGHLWKGLNKAEHLWISVNITGNVWELLWTSMKISRHLWKCLNITENFWKLLFQLWNGLKTSVGAFHSWLVFDLCYIDFLWITRKTAKEKENKIIIRTKQTNFRQKTRIERATYCFKRYLPNRFRCYPLHKTPPPPTTKVG